MFQDLNYKQLEDRNDIVWIDVRSEGEFSESTIPNALNVALFNDEERARIGTLYKQVGPKDAQIAGLEIASQKLPVLYREIEDALQGKWPVVFCWRGGMRSKSVATILDLMGMPVIRLTGGYRDYRQYVTEYLSVLTERDIPQAVVIHGMTGVGKTSLLHLLKSAGEPVLDLEGIARHRGSVFGGIGLHAANQRQFDSALYEELKLLSGKPYMFMEAESKRIGRATIPDFLMTAKQNGEHIEILAPHSVRVQRILEQYGASEDDEFYHEVFRAIRFIEKRFSPDLRKRVNEWLQIRDYHSLVEALLKEYYDSRYEYARLTYSQPIHAIDSGSLEEMVQKIQSGLLRTRQV